MISSQWNIYDICNIVVWSEKLKQFDVVWAECDKYSGPSDQVSDWNISSCRRRIGVSAGITMLDSTGGWAERDSWLSRRLSFPPSSFLLPACLCGALRLPSPVSHQALFSRDRRSQVIRGDRRQVPSPPNLSQTTPRSSVSSPVQWYHSPLYQPGDLLGEVRWGEGALHCSALHSS